MFGVVVGGGVLAGGAGVGAYCCGAGAGYAGAYPAAIPIAVAPNAGYSMVVTLPSKAQCMRRPLRVSDL